MEKSLCSKITWVIRILLWAGMLAFWLMKLWAPADKVAFIWNAWHSLLPFLSADIWFWIATLWEIVAGLFLLTGACTSTWALLTGIIMLFALNATWFADPMAWVFFIWALIILYKGSGAWAMRPTWGCCDKTCSDKACGDKNEWASCSVWWCGCWCSGGSCSCLSKQEEEQQEEEK